MEVNSDPRAPAGRIRRSGQGQGTYVSRPSNPAPTSSLVPADDGMATQCRAQSRRCLRRALLLLVPAVRGVSLSQRQDVRVRVREAAGHGRTWARIQYPTVLESRTQRPCITLTHVPSPALARPSQTPNVTWRAGRRRQAGRDEAPERERGRKACECEPFQAVRCVRDSTMHLVAIRD